MNLKVNIAGVDLKNPVMPASGTFGSGKEYSDFIDLNKLGAIVTKGVANIPWKGNKAPRVAETYGGMLNSVGLQNPGIKVFKKDDLKFLEKFDTKVMVNVAGRTIEDYIEVVEELNNEDVVNLLEINISCPNIKCGGVAFGTDPNMASKVVREVKKRANKPIIVKLSPNVRDITEIAKAVESVGADGVSLINTLLGMRVDIKKRKPILDNIVGGLSGPAIKPVALRMVYQVAKEVDIPVIGIGGIENHEDALEFLLCGASALQVGTANFYNPTAMVDIIDGIENYLRSNNIEDVNEIIGVI